MPLFGAHMSIAGGYYKSLLLAQQNACDTVQLFTKNNSQWYAKPLSEEDVRLFHETLQKTKLRLPIAHDCYLINLASPDPALQRKSIDSFVHEMQRAEALGLAYLVTHPGTPTDSDEPAGLARVARALDEVHQQCRKFRVQVLLENTAGQGASLGHRFEHLARILDRTRDPDRVGVCFDTCHAFAAGYPLAPLENYTKTFKEFGRLVGIKKLKAFHVNDSKKPLGSRVDRHAHIGQGLLGLEPFRLLVNDRRFRRHPMLLETPKETLNGQDMDAANLATLRGLLAQGA